jgi:type IV fimbrial biogenesis protein FimT
MDFAMKIYNQTGFSLTELLVTTSLISIVSGIGVPSMSDFIKNDRLSTQINTLVGHLSLARSQAVTLAQPVSVCASSDLVTCGSNDWASGWIVYVDADASGDVSAGDDVLRVHEALPGNSTLSSSAGSAITFDDRGFAPANAGSFSLCDDRGVEHLKSITISNTGRVRRGGSASCA